MRDRKGQAGTMATVILVSALSGCALEPITLESGEAAQPQAPRTDAQRETIIVEQCPSYPTRQLTHAYR